MTKLKDRRRRMTRAGISLTETALGVHVSFRHGEHQGSVALANCETDGVADCCCQSMDDWLNARGEVNRPAMWNYIRDRLLVKFPEPERISLSQVDWDCAACRVFGETKCYIVDPQQLKTGGFVRVRTKSSATPEAAIALFQDQFPNWTGGPLMLVQEGDSTWRVLTLGGRRRGIKASQQEFRWYLLCNRNDWGTIQYKRSRITLRSATPV